MNLDSFVLAVLVGESHQHKSATLECIERWGFSKHIEIDVIINHHSRHDYFGFLEMVREKYPKKHLIVMHADIFFAEDFLQRLLAQIELIEATGAEWGLLGPAGINYPYFKIVRNMIDHHGILYPFPKPMLAIHLDGHLLVIHKDLRFDFENDYRGFHHYDTLLCIQSWVRCRSVFIINLPLRHLGQGNLEEWKQSSEALGLMLGKIYGNKSLMTSMGPVPLVGVSGVTRDFYKHEVDLVLESWISKRIAPNVVLVIRVHADDIYRFRETLLSVCAQFVKPARVILLYSPEIEDQLSPLLQYFGSFIHIVSVSCSGAALAPHGDALFGSSFELGKVLPEDGVVTFLDANTVLFPNFVRDFQRFHMLGVDVAGVVAALDFNYAVQDCSAGKNYDVGRLLQGWKTENVDDLVVGFDIPLTSFAIPVSILRAILDDHLYGALTERLLVLKFVARAPVYFLRRLGGLVHKSTTAPTASPDTLAEISEQSEYFRTHYPLGYMWMKQWAGTNEVPVQASIGLSREQALAMKFSEYPRLINAIYKIYRVTKRLKSYIFPKSGSLGRR